MDGMGLSHKKEDPHYGGERCDFRPSFNLPSQHLFIYKGKGFESFFNDPLKISLGFSRTNKIDAPIYCPTTIAKN